MFTFVVDDVPIELAVLPRQARHNPPLSAISERPERGLDARAVERLLSEDDARRF